MSAAESLCALCHGGQTSTPGAEGASARYPRAGRASTSRILSGTGAAALYVWSESRVMETACVVMLTVALTNLYGLIAVGDGPSVDTVCLWARPTIHLAQRGKAAALEQGAGSEPSPWRRAMGCAHNTGDMRGHHTNWQKGLGSS